jgi:ABC-type phosphate transport system substrate-binding protein
MASIGRLRWALTTALASGVAALALLAMPSPAVAATIDVSTVPGLLNAIAAGSPGDVVILAPGTYTLPATTGGLVIARNLTIQGSPSGAGATINASLIGAHDYGDGIYVDVGVNATIRNVHVTGAVAPNAGIAVAGNLTLESAALTANAGPGLWMLFGSTGTVTSTTIANNTGRGVLTGNFTTLTLANTTVAGNGTLNISNPGLSAATLNLVNTIVSAAGTPAGTCTQDVQSSVSSIDSTGDCGADIVADPLLGPLTSTGSSTPYRPLLVSPTPSPAINSAAPGCPSSDQRGFGRSGPCDIGAVEYQDTVAPVLAGVPSNLTVTATSGSGAVVTFTAPTATDDVSGSRPVTCSPPSGALYPIGTATVTCTATDLAGNTAAGTFTISVLPTQGVAGCTTTGKVSGRGSTLARAAFEVFVRGFRDDLCGAVGSGDASLDGSTMAVYNGAGLPVGSGSAIASVACRVVSFGFSDIPVTTADLALLNGPVPTTISPSCSPFQSYIAPVVPSVAPFPSPTDLGNKQVMVFPIGGTAVGIGVNLGVAQCGTSPTAPQLTMDELSRILGGEIKNWSDATLRTGGRNATLATCNVPIVRVVRQDRSGTTQIMKNALAKGAHGPRASAGCGSGNAWSFYAQDSRNTAWPDSPTSPDSTCSDLLTAPASGSAPLLALCATTAGAICFADQPDMQVAPGNTLKRPTLRNAADTSFVSPLAGLRANCNFSAVAPPGSGSTGWVNLDPTDTWALDNGFGNRSDVTFTGSGYPICGLTFGLVYTGLKDGAVANPVARLNGNQRRTLLGLFLYGLSSLGQDRLNTAFYAALPATAVTQIRAGFQASY